MWLSSSCHLSDFNGLLRHNRCHFKWNFIATSRNFYCPASCCQRRCTTTTTTTTETNPNTLTACGDDDADKRTSGPSGQTDSGGHWHEGGSGDSALWSRRNGNQIVAFKSKLMAAKLKEATTSHSSSHSSTSLATIAANSSSACPRIKQKPNKPQAAGQAEWQREREEAQWGKQAEQRCVGIIL